MYSVSIRNSEKVAVPRISPPTFAPATVFVRRIPKRIRGSACRRSHQPNAASSATAAAMTPIVRPEPQPYVPLWVIAYTSDTSPPVTSTAPRASNDFTLVSRLSSRRRGARKKAATPTGTFTKKIHVRGSKTTVRLQNEAFQGVNLSFETLQARSGPQQGRRSRRDAYRIARQCVLFPRSAE